MLGTMGAAEEMPADLDSVSNDLALAMFTSWGYGFDRAFETVEHMFGSANRQLESFVIVISADFTLGHWDILCALVDGWMVVDVVYPGEEGRWSRPHGHEFQIQKLILSSSFSSKCDLQA